MTSTENSQTSEQRWTTVQLFGDDNAHHGSCCECCNGYCPREDVEGEPGVEMLVEVGDYLSDRYVAIHSDLVSLNPGEVPMKPGISIPDGWRVPDEKPGPSTALFVASRVLRLTVLGVEVRDGGAGKAPQHLYLGDHHIGYLMPARRGRTLDQCAELRRVEESLNASRDKAWELMVHLPMENVDALATILDAGDALRQTFGVQR